MPNINAQALFNACADGDAAAVSRLLPAGGTRVNLSGLPFQRASDKATPLMQAAWRGHTNIVRMILERAPNTAVDHADTTRGTALLVAAQFLHADIVRLLADRGANVNVVGQRGCKALREAVVGRRGEPDDPDGARQLATIKVLLAFGAAPDPVDDWGETPLCIACGLGNAHMVEALLDGLADVDFAIPAQGGYWGVVDRLLAMVGMSSNRVPGFTPIMYAARGNHAAVVKMLLERRADGTKTTTRRASGIDAGSTALDVARLYADSDPDFGETFAVLHKRCCSTCGVTSLGLAATEGGAQYLKRCGSCPARGPSSWYCGSECQRADWEARHNGECAAARRARQAAGTEV